jgi:hypothetical protein
MGRQSPLVSRKSKARAGDDKTNKATNSQKWRAHGNKVMPLL